jgi:hypothetical protein
MTRPRSFLISHYARRSARRTNQGIDGLHGVSPRPRGDALSDRPSRSFRRRGDSVAAASMGHEAALGPPTPWPRFLELPGTDGLALSFALVEHGRHASAFDDVGFSVPWDERAGVPGSMPRMFPRSPAGFWGACVAGARALDSCHPFGVMPHQPGWANLNANPALSGRQ